jgi:hypothetical protein
MSVLLIYLFYQVNQWVSVIRLLSDCAFIFLPLLWSHATRWILFATHQGRYLLLTR